jgi:hypothetical protein
MNNFQSPQEREGFIKMYGAYWANVLSRFVGLVTEAARHNVTESEAVAKAKAMFIELQHVHNPASHAPVAAYKERMAEEEKQRTEASAAAFYRQRDLQEAHEAHQRDLARAHDDRVAAARRDEDRKAREHREQFEREQREKQAAEDRESARMAEAAETLLRRIDKEA